jgi:diguanylate cyclase (GGDEF)-like protein/PAS domain S-box-containing protein
MATPDREAPEPLLAGLDETAPLARADLPGALIAVFDTDLRLLVAAGRALGPRASSPAYREGHALGESFAPELWLQIEPLCRSALRGETRSRRILGADGRPRLALDVGPLAPAGGPPSAEISSGVAVILDLSGSARAPTGESDPAPTARLTPAEQSSPAGESCPAPVGQPERHSQEHFEEVFLRAPLGTGLLDPEGRWVLVNQALCDITGYTSEELLRRRFHDFTHPEDRDNDVGRRRQLLDGELSAYQVEKRYFNAAGETLSALLSVSLVRDRELRPLHFIVQLQDISERKRLEEHLRHLADHDPLTGLRNRRLFEHDLRHQVGRCQRYEEQAALIAIDLDGFKAVNDLHGHRVGDEALRAVARMLTRRLRATDLVARLGGDEFAVLLPHMDLRGAEIVCEDLRQVIATCAVDTGETLVRLAASTGFTLLDRETLDDATALDAADRAMYANKRARARVVRV